MKAPSPFACHAPEKMRIHPSPTDKLDETAINRLLVDLRACASVTVLDRCDSTNALLAHDAVAGRPNGTVITTEVQELGRGRRGRTWIAPPGGSLVLSMLWNFDRGATALAGLSLAAGVAVVTALRRIGQRPISLKWPNDIVFNGAKLGGILVETRTGSSGAEPVMAIVGIGINVRLRDLDRVAISASGDAAVPAQQVTDLASIVDCVPGRNELLAQIVAELATALARFELEGFRAFRTPWMAMHAYQNESVGIAFADGSLLDAKAVGIADDGALIVETAGGIRHIHAGEVSVRRVGESTARPRARDHATRSYLP